MGNSHDIDAQVHALLGGDRLAARAPSAVRADRVKSRSGWTWGRIAAGLTLAGLAVFSGVVLTYGLRRSAEAEAQRMAAELQALATTGGTAGASELLDKLGALPDRLHDGRHRGIMLRTEATLYRSHDADPQRLQRIEAALETPEGLSELDLVLIRTLIASRADRLSQLSNLARLGADSEDPLVAFLMASALSRAGSAEQASAAFDRALELEPSNLEHLAGFAAHQYAGGHSAEAAELLDVMREVDPISGWTKQVAAMLRVELPPSEQSHEVPVAGAWTKIYLATVRLGENDRVVARALVAEAVQEVHAQPAFLVDFVDFLLSRGYPDAAGIVIGNPSWSNKTAGAMAAQGRYLLAQGDIPGAANVLSQAVAAGFADPVSGLAYIEALGAAGGQPATVRKVARELADAWPDNVDVAAAVREKVAPAPEVKKKRRRKRKRSR